MTRLTITVDNIRLGSILLDGATARLVVAPPSTAEELWDALGAVYWSLQGPERASVEQGGES